MCTNGVRFLSTLILLTASLFAQREDAWRSDIDLFARELPARHGDLFQNLSREQFYDELRELSSTVAQKTDGQMTAGLLRVVAMARDSHTTVFHALNILPIEVTWFQEGLFVTAALPEFGELIGARVLKFHETTSEDALNRVASLISHENQHRLKARSQVVLATTPLLFAQGIVPEPSKAVLELAMANGESRHVELPSVGVSYRSLFMAAARRTDGYIPLAQRDPATPYWYEYLPDRKTLYLAFNHSREDFQNQFTSFANRMIADLAGKAVERVIIDLRHNGGGSPEYFEALVKFAKQSAFNTAKYYGLIGRNTFSAGMFHAYQLQQELGATLIGEPTGGRPWAWGYVGQFSLPFSRLTVQYSTQFYRLTPEDREALMPDVAIELRAADHFSRFDPWFASALSDGAKPGSLRLAHIPREDNELDDGGALLRFRVTAADASVFFGHTEAEVAERTAAEDNWQVTVRVPAGMKGETPIYAVASGELSNPVIVSVQ